MRRTQRGFTLIELLIAASLGLLVVYSIYNVFISQNRVYEFQSSVAAMNEAALKGIDVMLGDLRAIGYRDESGNPILFADAKQIRFRADLDDDGSLEEVEFKEVSQDGMLALVRIENGAAQQTLVKDLAPPDGVNFTYYDKDGRAVTDTSTEELRNSIRSLKVVIAVRTRLDDPITKTAKVINLESYLQPRNLALYRPQ